MIYKSRSFSRDPDQVVELHKRLNDTRIVMQGRKALWITPKWLRPWAVSKHLHIFITYFINLFHLT